MVINVDGTVPDEAIANIAAIKGIDRARYTELKGKL
jgi:hypothetical protein